MTVAEAIEKLKKLPPNLKLMTEYVSDSGWREDVEVTEIIIETNWDWDGKSPITPDTHYVSVY